MEQETRYQRVAREQRERQAARQQRVVAADKAAAKAARKAARIEREARRERRYLDIITSDHDHSMDY